MSNTEFKKAFDDVSPDMFMQTRILANIKSKKKKRFPLKAVISAALALVVVVACVGSISYKSMYTDRPFSVMVVDASDDMHVTEEISAGSISLPILNIEYDPQGAWSTNNITGESGYAPSVGVSSQCGLAVSGDDIASVRYECQNDMLTYGYTAKMYYDIQNQDYYSVIIPIPDDRVDEVKALINQYTVNPEEQGIKDYAQLYDISEYFDGKDTDLDNYQVIFEKCSNLGYPEDNDGYAFYLVENDWGERYGVAYDSDITVDYYELNERTLAGFTDDEITAMYAVNYYPYRATDILFENPDVYKSTLPGDEITVTVTFKDGKKAKKVITVSFDEDGNGIFAYK